MHRAAAALLMTLLVAPAIGGCASILAAPLLGGALIEANSRARDAAVATHADEVAGPAEVMEPGAGTGAIGVASAADADADAEREVSIAAGRTSQAPGGDAEASPGGAASMPAPVRQSAFGPANPGSGPIAFASHSLSQADRDPVLVPRLSALLRDPSSLAIHRSDCGTLPVAALIDLDEADGIFDPGSARRAPRELPLLLDNMRRNGIVVGWISDLPGERGAGLREYLGVSQLDPDAQDVLLLASDGERKQLRRERFAATHCVVAILGQDMADFDELYAYLINPADADHLAAMLGAGWFLLDATSQAGDD